MEGLGWQVIGKINSLPDGDDGDPRYPNNCCPVCCGPCHALNAMLDDPIMFNQLGEIIALTSYSVDSWDFWLDGRLDVVKIKKMWFNADGTRKAVCASTNGVDESDEWHDMMEAGDLHGDDGP